MKKLNLEVKFLHDCLLIKDILVIGDLHIGYDEQFHGKAVFPGYQLKEIIEKLEGVFKFLEKGKIRVKKIILLGDVKHDFGEITDIEWRETLEFFDFLNSKLVENLKGKLVKKTNKLVKKTNKIIVVKGNHDTKLAPILKKRGILLKNYYKLSVNREKFCFIHGNKLFKQCLNSQTDSLFLGHLHPAITLYDKYKSEKYKCFLTGKWEKKKVYILPSFSQFSFGYELREISKINRNFCIIPNSNLKNFNVVVYNNKENKEYNFGRLKMLMKKLL